MKDTRDHILKVALGLFLQDSFKGVTLSQLVKKTGLSKGAFYHYFESKEQLLHEILTSFLIDANLGFYSKFSKDSLHQFLQDYMADAELRRRTFGLEDSEKALSKKTNHYILIFEGIKLFPEFRKRVNDGLKTELEAWKNIVGIARKKGEIKSSMSDEEIAKMFIFSGDGSVLRLFLGNRHESIQEDILGFWEGFYNQLKA
jgi:TetR/AcrR family transcriptional regulator, transcriptional repressor for nem operon